MLSSPRRTDTTIRIFSSAVYCLRVLRRISQTVLSAGSFLLIDFCLIFVPFGHYDEPEILRYAITSIRPKGADVRHFRIDRYRLRHKLFEGDWSGEIEREVFERGHAVTVLLFDPDRDKLVFIEQFRPGAYAALASPWFDNGASPWLIECVAGIIEPGESPEDVARREAIEEADCEVSDIVPVCHYLLSPGRLVGIGLRLLWTRQRAERRRHPRPEPRAREHPRRRLPRRGLSMAR